MLTPKEIEVLVLRHQGLLQREVAERLGITQGAVCRFEQNAIAKIQLACTDFASLQRAGVDLRVLVPDAPWLPPTSGG